MEPALQIVLTQLESGQVGIKTDGPEAENMTALLGLLEFAKITLMTQLTQRQQPEIVPGTLLPRNGRRG